jgi:hypothetical protein
MRVPDYNHWKLVNFLARFVGYCFAFGGLIVAVSCIPSREWIGCVTGGIFTVLGFFLIKAKPFNPN